MFEMLDLYEDSTVLAVCSNEFKTNDFYTVNELKSMSFKDTENVYFTPNSIRKIKGKLWRDSDHINAYECLFCDLDIEHITDTELQQIDTTAIINYLQNHVLCGDYLPEPTMIVNSGHGLHVYWKIKPTTDSRKWLSMQTLICNYLSQYGADRKVSADKIHVLRVPESVNKKSGRQAVSVQTLSYNPVIYDLDDLIRDFIPNYSMPEPRKKSYCRYQRQQKVISFYDKLYQQRCDDLATLFKMRDSEGSRELILFLYRYYQEHITQSPEIALAMTLQLNKSVKHGLSEREIKTRTKSAHKYHADLKQLNISTKWIVDTLQITVEEMKELKVLVSADVKKDRKRAYNKQYYQDSLLESGKLSKADEINIRRTKIKKLLEKGQGQAEICESLSISRATYFNDLKVIRDKDFVESFIPEPQPEVAEATGTDDCTVIPVQSNIFRHKLSTVPEFNDITAVVLVFPPPDD